MPLLHIDGAMFCHVCAQFGKKMLAVTIKPRPPNQMAAELLCERHMLDLCEPVPSGAPIRFGVRDSATGYRVTLELPCTVTSRQLVAMLTGKEWSEGALRINDTPMLSDGDLARLSVGNGSELDLFV